MNILSLDELKSLAQQQDDTCISLYLPVHRTDPEQEQDPIRFRNLCHRAAELLLDSGLESETIKRFLQPVRELDHYEFWQHQDNGLALFCAQGGLRTYNLPISPEEQVVVAQHFYIKPLLPLFNQNQRFFILGLSQHRVRLLEGTPYSVNEIDVQKSLPSLDEFLRFEPEERQVQAHMGTPGVTQQRGAMGGGTVFHGHGAGEVEDKEQLRLYFRHLEEHLQPWFQADSIPLVLAGVDYIVAIYRESSTYPHLIDESIAGNPELLSPKELHAQAWELTQPYFAQAQALAMARYKQFHGTGHASEQLSEIILAAAQGRVECLFVAIDQQQWGRVDSNHQTVELHLTPESGDLELLDYAATQTILNRGIVYALERETMPEQAILAAIFRY